MSSMEFVLASVIVACLAAIGVGVYNGNQKPTIEIKKSEWSCTRSETTSTFIPMPFGQSTAVMPMAGSRCMEYRRNAE
jgi:hypothetical protein